MGYNDNSKRPANVITLLSNLRDCDRHVTSDAGSSITPKPQKIQTFQRAERLLLDALALRADKNKNWRCFPSYSMLSRDTQLSMRHLKDSARALKEKGFIKIHVRANKSNFYKVEYDFIEEKATRQRLEDDKLKFDQNRSAVDGDEWWQEESTGRGKQANPHREMRDKPDRTEDVRDEDSEPILDEDDI